MKLCKQNLAVAVALCTAALFAGGKPKYVFVFIGDGMSTPQRMVAEDFAAKIGYGELAMNRLPYQTNTRTKSANSIITDSAAAATAIACGVKTGNGMLGVTHDGTPVASVAEVAKRRGWKVGIITTTTIMHATPAAVSAARRTTGLTNSTRATSIRWRGRPATRSPPTSPRGRRFGAGRNASARSPPSTSVSRLTGIRRVFQLHFGHLFIDQQFP